MPWIGEGRVQAELLSDGRSIQLLRSLTYEDKDKVYWSAYIGDVVDGASIPSFFWRVIGSPLTGKYRRASVIHDVYCQAKRRASWRVHRVFYQIMIEDDVPPWKAKVMYVAVTMFGPKFMKKKDL